MLVDNNSNIYNNIDFSETGTIVTGPTSSISMPHTMMLAVTETLTIFVSYWLDVTGVSNSFTERLAVPEPSNWAMMVLVSRARLRRLPQGVGNGRRRR